jgi:hypothetical protein
MNTTRNNNGRRSTGKAGDTAGAFLATGAYYVQPRGTDEEGEEAR